MAMIITQKEMLQYSGKEEAVFPAGTILTPLAKDYAAENNIRIVICESNPISTQPNEACSNDVAREKLLKDIVNLVKKNAALSGNQFSSNEIEKMVVACIERIGCSVIM